MRIFLIGFALLMFCHGATWAAPTARSTKRYAIRDVRFEGNSSEAERRHITDQVWNIVEMLIGGERFEVVARENVELLLKTRSDLRLCYEKRCKLELGERLGATRLLSFDVKRTGPVGPIADWEVQTLNYDVDSNRILGPYDLSCKRCTVDNLLEEFSHSLATVYRTDGPVPLCMLELDTLPANAAVQVDSTELGRTPFHHTVSAGKHNIRVTAEQFAPGEALVDCPAHGKQALLLTLNIERSSVVAKNNFWTETTHSKKLLAAGGALLTLGLVGIVWGAADLGIDQTPTCNVAQGQLLCPQRYKTGLQGDVLLGIGAGLAVGGGVTLLVDWLLSRQHKIRPEMRISADGASIGMKGNF